MPDGHAAPPATAADLIARAARLGPALAAGRAEALERRRLPDATIAALVDAGMFKLLQPARLGGLELPYGAQVAVSAELARHCGAAGWLASVVATHHWMLAKFDARAQDEVWGKDPDTIVCSAFGFAEAKVSAVDGGWRARGRWTYASGSHAAGWAMIGLPIEQPGKPPARSFALVPRADFQVLDNWHAAGLRGSGSNDIVLEDAFIPAHRTVGFDVIDRIDSPGTAVNTGATYRLPTFNVFNLTGVGPALGLAQGALDAFAGAMKQRRNVFGSKVPELQNIQIRVSEASAEIDAGRTIAQSHVAMLQDMAARGAGCERGDLLRLQRDCAYVGKLCLAAVNRLLDAQGAGGLGDTNPVNLAIADLRGVTAHLTMGWDANCVPYGKYLLGVEHHGII
ncbi:MAG: acyl-CoA dehydrogenase family protein [Rhodospirillaceae bacterium]|nr:acyl-CoA dehydrogenase family protein [Rhodospirillaceae bacterium]